jgi:HD-like signal output (HDOD) protein
MEREELFLIGLLHDLGKVPFGDEYLEVLKVARNEQVPLIDVERDLLGIDHQQVGRLIAEKWKLNDAVTTCISGHHNLTALDADHGLRVALVALGNIYTNIYDHGYAGDPFPSETGIVPLLDYTGLSLTDYASIGDKVVEEIHKAEIFLQI